MLASEHLNTSTGRFPNFNTPEKKAELYQFAKKISDEYSLLRLVFPQMALPSISKAFSATKQQRFQELSLKLLYLGEELIMWLVGLH